MDKMLLTIPYGQNSQFQKAIANSKARIQNNAQFKLIEDNAKWIDNEARKNNYSFEVQKKKKTIEETAKKYKPVQNDYSLLSL
jgi:carboxyl-terminal processing protease